MILQVYFGTLQIFGGVDTYGCRIRYAHAYRVATLQPSQLLQLLRLFEWGGLQCRNLTQYLSTKGVESEVLVEGVALQPLASFHTSQIRNDRTREVECMPLLAYSHLWRIRVFERFRAVALGKWRCESHDIGLLILETPFEQLDML